MSTQTLHEQIQKVCDDVQANSLRPVLDGRYKLPDRRILIKDGNILRLIGHRDKKQQREIGHWSKDKLISLLTLKCYGGYDRDKIAKMSKESLVRLYYPRPVQTFSIHWLDSQAPSAIRLRELVEKATKI